MSIVTPPEPATKAQRAGRFGGVVALGALSLFLGALTVGVLGAKVEGHAVLALLLRVFFACIVGGLALFVALVAVNTARTPAEEVGLPASLPSFCPACGEPTATDAALCGRCDHLLLARDTRWTKVERSGPLVLAFLTILGLGLLALGAFMGVGPILEGERRAWKLASASALALMVGSFGLLFLWGSVSTLKDELFSAVKWVYRFQRREPAGISVANAEASFRRGELAGAHGSSEAMISLFHEEQTLLALPELVPEQRAFVEAIDHLFDAGSLAAWRSRSIEWHWASPPSGPSGVRRETRDEVRLRVIEALPPPELRALFERLARVLLEPISVAELWRKVRDTPALRAELAKLPFRERDAPQPTPVEAAVSAAIRENLLN